MYAEDELLPLSGLQHLAFCRRQCALIHIEKLWEENYLTASGRVMHDAAHNGRDELRGNDLTVRGLPLRSLRLGLAGVADVVEFTRVADGEEGVRLPNRRGRWRPYPVEYKRGRPKTDNCDAVQLCAQAICLEEALDCEIPEGSLYYGVPHRRTIVPLDRALREETRRMAEEFRALIASGTIPRETRAKGCSSCSLEDYCMPNAKRSARGYVDRYIKTAIEETNDD